MKRILNFPTLMLLFVAALFMTSCEDEPGTGGSGGGGGTTDSAASISLTSDSDLTLAPLEEFSITIAADKGTNEMNAVTVYEDGVKVSIDRLKFNGVGAAANPILITGTDRDALDWTVSIIAQSDASAVSNYEVEIQDTDGLTSSVTVTVTTASTPPTLVGSAPMAFEIVAGAKNGFNLTGTKGGSQLYSLEVRQDDVTVDAEFIEWDGVNMMSMGNPFELTGSEVDGFEDVTLFVDLPTTTGSYVYTFILEDVSGGRDTVTYNVTTTIAGTAIDLREDVLFNAAGPAGTGGLDLDNGMSTGSNSVDAELRDNGSDFSMPSSINWRQTVSAVNGATMKYVVASANGVPEGFTFDGVSVKEELEGLYTENSGAVIDESNSTSIVQPGDTFIVQKGSQYWLVTAKAVNVKADDGDNSDNYVFDVKY